MTHSDQENLHKAKRAEHKIRNLHNLHVEVKYDKPMSISIISE